MVFTGIFLAIAIAVTLAFTTSQAIARPVVSKSGMGIKFPATNPRNYQQRIGSLANSFNQLIQWVSEYMQKRKDAKKATDVANEAKSCFLENTIHQLPTYFNGILGYAQISRSR